MIDQPDNTQAYVGCLNDQDSINYWKKQTSSAKPLSDKQKELLADLEAGKLMRLSKLELVDENLQQSKKI